MRLQKPTARTFVYNDILRVRSALNVRTQLKRAGRERLKRAALSAVILNVQST